MKYCYWFNELNHSNLSIAGGKGANLGEMTQAGLPVPNGFVISSNAYFKFLDKSSLKNKIKSELEHLDTSNSEKLQVASEKVKTSILSADIPKDIAEQILVFYKELSGIHNRKVAVRSSATAEDLPDASFAGQQETFLNVIGDDEILEAVRGCWASLFEARAIFYRQDKGYDHFKVGIAVPVQLMIQSEVSGIMFTVNPITNNSEEISIEAAFGLGQPIVSGEVTPDQYMVSKNGYKLIDKQIIKQTWQLTEFGNLPISLEYQKKQKLSDKNITKLAEIGAKIEKHYKTPQDIEWAMQKNKLFIVQSRPITTLKIAETTLELDKENLDSHFILEGLAASPGIGIGKVVIIKNKSEIGKIKEGDVLVTEMTNPDFVPAMRKAVAIVTDKGGRTSHAAIVSREIGVPCVVGTSLATHILKNGEMITVDGKNGKVYEGSVKMNEVGKVVGNTFHLKTATKVYVNLGEPELADEVSKLNTDGIGLLRAEFMISTIGKHPRKFIEEKNQKEFVSKLADCLEKFCNAFGDRPVVYRATDFKTNEYKTLEGGEKYETDEPNPMIGFRGAGRYVADAEVFELELKAIKEVRNKRNCKNLWLMIPFIRNPKELIDVKKIISANGMKRSHSFKLWMMCETPGNVHQIEEYIAAGIDGVSIGSNDLTMLTLGVDRDNEKVAGSYDESNPAVVDLITMTIKACKRHKVTCSICGQMASDYPELVKLFVKAGITSVSVSADVLDVTRKNVYDAENDIANKK